MFSLVTMRITSIKRKKTSLKTYALSDIIITYVVQTFDVILHKIIKYRVCDVVHYIDVNKLIN